MRSLARRYAGRGEALEDIEQVGAIGLIKAIDRFELEREVSLATYATPNVVGEIKRHFRDKGWAIRVPRALQELCSKEFPGFQITTTAAIGSKKHNSIFRQVVTQQHRDGLQSCEQSRLIIECFQVARPPISVRYKRSRASASRS